MNKQVLFSLLGAAAIAPFGANADITVAVDEDFTNEGITLKEGSDLDLFGEGTVEGDNATNGALVCQIPGLPIGTYRLTAQTCENAELSVSGEGVSYRTMGSVTTFTVTEMNTTVTVTVKCGTDAAYDGFTVGGFTLDIKFNGTFAELQEQLLDGIDDIETILRGADANGLLASDKDLLESEIEAYKESLNALTEEGKSELDIYKNEALGLYNNPYTCQAELNALNAKIAELNAAITAENNRYKQEQANNATVGGWDASVDEFLAAVQQYASDIKLLPESQQEYVSGKCDPIIEADRQAAKAIQNRIDALQEKYAKGNGNIAEDPEAQAIEEAIAALNIQPLEEAYNSAVANAEAWDAMQTYEPELKALYDKIALEFMGVKDYPSEMFNGVMQDYNYGTNVKGQLDYAYDQALQSLADFLHNNETGGIENAAENSYDALAAYEAAVKALTKIETTVMDNVKEVAELNSTWTDNIAALNKALQNAENMGDQFDGTKVSIEALQDQAADIAEAIDALEAQTKNANQSYKPNLFPTDEDYADIEAQIQELVDGYEALLPTLKIYNDNVAQMNQWYADLQAAVDAIIQDSPNGFKDIIIKFGYNNGKATAGSAYAGALQAVKDGVAAMGDNKTEELGQGIANSVDKAISDFRAAGLAASGAVNDALEVYTNALEAIPTVYPVLKVLPTGTDKVNLDEYVQGIADYLSNLHLVVNASVANDIVANVKAYYGEGGDGEYLVSYPDEIKDAIADWYKTTVEGNMALLNNKYEQYANLLDPTLNPNAAEQYGPAYEGLKKDLVAIKTLVDACQAAVDAAPDAEDVNTAYENVNEVTKVTEKTGNIIDVYNKMIQTFEPAIGDAAENVQNYLKVSNQAAALERLLSSLEAWTEANSTEPATAGWIADELNDLFNNIKRQLKPIMDDVQEQYEKNDLDATEAAQAIEDIQKLYAPVDEYKADVKANEEAHNAQVLESQEAWRDLNNAVTALTNSSYSNEVTVPVTYTNSKGETVSLGNYNKTGWINYINNLRNDITSLDNQVYDEFEAHRSPIFDPDYADIQAQIAAIQKAFVNEYQQSVIDHNNDLVKNLFGDTFFWLNLAYKNAVETYEQLADNNTTDLLYNDYVNALLRVGKAKMTAQDINDITAMYGGDFANEVHLEVYEKDAEIESIRTQIQNILDTANYDTIQVLDESAFAAVQAEVDDLLDYFQNYTTTVTKDANDFADSYYSALYAEAEAMINDAKTALEEAGVPGSYINVGLAVPQAALDKAEALFNAARNGQSDTLSLQMGQILAQFAKIGTSDNSTANNLDLQTIVDNYWTYEYNNAVAAVEDIIEAIKDINAADNTNALATAQNALASIKALNSGVTLDNVKDKVDALNGYVQDAQNALDELKQAAQDNIDNANAQKDFLNQLTDLDDIFTNEILPQIGRLDLTIAQFNSLDIAGIYDSIWNLEKTVNATYNCADRGVKASIQSAIDEIEYNMYGALVADTQDTSVPADINGAIALDKQNINAQFPELRIQFNKLRAEMTNENGTINTDDEAQLREWAAMITAAETAYAELPAIDWAAYKTGLNDIMPSAIELVDALVELEAQVNEVREALGLEPIDNSTLANAQATLDGQAAMVEAAIKAGLEALSEYMDSVKAEYEPKYNAPGGFEDQLQFIKDQYGIEKNALLMLDNFEKELKALLTEVQATNTDAAAAQAAAAAEANKVQANNAAYASLTAQLDALEDALEAAKTFVKQYGEIAQETQYVDQAAGIQNEIDNARALLEQKYNAVELNAVSDLATINAQEIATNIEGYKAIIAYQYAWSVYGDMKDTVSVASNAVKGDHANQAELDAQLAELLEAVEPLDSSVRMLVGKTLEEDYYTEVDALVAVMKQLTADAAALIDACEENAVEVGDLDGNGDVTVADYMDLLKLILSGEDYDSTNKEHVAGDLNKNGRLDSADLVALINIIRGTSEAPARVLAAMGTQGANKVSLEWVAQQDNVRRLAIVLDNSADFSHLMFDIQLPAGMNIVNEGLAERAAGLNFFSNDLGNGIHRILIASSELNTIEGSNGAVVYLDIEGSDSGNIVVEKAEGSDTRGALYSVDNSDANTSGINTLGDYLKSGVDKIYDLGGRMMNKVQQGINIIRNADGTTTKTLKKH